MLARSPLFGADAPFVYGPIAAQLTPADIAEVVATCSTPGKPAWLLEAYRLRHLSSENWFVDVHLAPDRTSPRLRRGEVNLCHSSDPVEPGQPVRWVSRGGHDRYAQVALQGSEFGESLQNPAELERPFNLLSEIGDEDLVSLVDFVRSSAGGKAKGGLPIRLVLRTAEGLFVVQTMEREDTGEQVEIRRVDGQWVLEEVSQSRWSVSGR